MAPEMAFRSPRSLVEAGTSIPDLYEWNARENAEYPLFRFHDGGAVRVITYGNTISAIRKVARHVCSLVGNKERLPIAVLANVGMCRGFHFSICTAPTKTILLDSITYCVNSVGILRAGHILFPVSVRNGAAAVADLLRRTSCSHVLVSQDEHMLSIAEQAAREVPSVMIYPIQLFDDLFSRPELPIDAASDEPALPNRYDIDDVAMILHSSGELFHAAVMPLNTNGNLQVPQAIRNQSTGPIGGWSVEEQPHVRIAINSTLSHAHALLLRVR